MPSGVKRPAYASAWHVPSIVAYRALRLRISSTSACVTVKAVCASAPEATNAPAIPHVVHHFLFTWPPLAGESTLPLEGGGPPKMGSLGSIEPASSLTNGEDRCAR